MSGRSPIRSARATKSAGYVEVRIDDVTVENLRKFAKLLSDMADKLEQSK